MPEIHTLISARSSWLNKVDVCVLFHCTFTRLPVLCIRLVIIIFNHYYNTIEQVVVTGFFFIIFLLFINFASYTGTNLIHISRYSREEPFTALNMDIRNQQHLFESLDTFVKGDLLEGANAYHCEKCDKKVDTVKRMCIKRLPKILCIQLKRFDYDWERYV